MTPISISINRKVPTVCFLLLSSAALEPADGSPCSSAGRGSGCPGCLLMLMDSCLGSFCRDHHLKKKMCIHVNYELLLSNTVSHDSASGFTNIYSFLRLLYHILYVVLEVKNNTWLYKVPCFFHVNKLRYHHPDRLTSRVIITSMLSQ